MERFLRGKEREVVRSNLPPSLPPSLWVQIQPQRAGGFREGLGFEESDLGCCRAASHPSLGVQASGKGRGICAALGSVMTGSGKQSWWEAESHGVLSSGAREADWAPSRRCQTPESASYSTLRDCGHRRKQLAGPPCCQVGRGLDPGPVSVPGLCPSA